MIIRFLFTVFILTWAAFITVPATAAEPVVTRYYSGIWDQPKHESQGILLQIINHEDDDLKKRAVAYWFTYGDDLNSAWYMAVGEVDGNRVVMILYEAEGIAFLADDLPGNESVHAVGTLVLTFRNCNHGVAAYDTSEDIGSGEFDIRRLAGLYNSNCSGGISDDTPSNAKPVFMDVGLEPAREGINGKGKAKFWERVDRSDFHVSAEDIADGEYSIFVCEDLVGSLTVFMGEGAEQFRSPDAEGQEILSFDPRNCLIELHDDAGAVLTSGDDVLAAKNNGNGTGNDHGNGKSEISVDLVNKNVYPDAEGKASYIEKNNSTEFDVEIKGVPAGTYPLWVGNMLRGEIVVSVDDDDDDDDGKLKGKIRFSDPQKGERELLNFEPRGKLVEVYEGSTAIFEVFFPE